MSANQNDKPLNGKSNNFDWIPYLATISLSTAGGAVIGGVPGAVIGFASSVVDTWFINNNWSSQNYLTTSIFWFSTALKPVGILTNAFPNYQLPIYSASLALSALTTCLTDDFLDFKNKIGLPLEALVTINNLFDEKKTLSYQEFGKVYNTFLEAPSQVPNLIWNNAKEIYNNKFLSSFLMNNGLNLIKITSDNLFLHLLASYSGNSFISTLIINNISEVKGMASRNISMPSLLKSTFVKSGAKIIAAYAIKSIIEYGIGVKQYYLDKKQKEMLLEKSTYLVLENGRKVLTHEGGIAIIQNLKDDLFCLLEGVNKINIAFAESVNGIVSLNNLIKYLPEALLPYLPFSIPVQLYLEKTVANSKEVGEEMGKANVIADQIKYDIIQNIEQINLRNGEDFVKDNYDSSLLKYNSYKKQLEYNAKVKSQAESFASIGNMIIDAIFLG